MPRLSEGPAAYPSSYPVATNAWVACCEGEARILIHGVYATPSGRSEIHLRKIRSSFKQLRTNNQENSSCQMNHTVGKPMVLCSRPRDEHMPARRPKLCKAQAQVPENLEKRNIIMAVGHEAPDEIIDGFRRRVLDPKTPLPAKYRALFALRNLKGAKAEAAMVSGECLLFLPVVLALF